MLDLARAAVKRQFLAPKHKGFRSRPSAPSVYLGGSCSRVKRVLFCLALVCISKILGKNGRRRPFARRRILQMDC